MSLSLDDVWDARCRISPYLGPTPLLRSHALETELGYRFPIYFKCEQIQPTGSFKIRGAFNALLTLSQEERARGVVTRSSGNFAQGVACAASTLGIRATIVMPENAPKIKVKSTRAFGPTLVFSDPSHELGQQEVERLVREQHLVPLHPYNSLTTMAGQGTAALEILEQCPQVDHFYSPLGGGGLLGGCATVIKSQSPKTQVYGVEPSGAADYAASRASGKKEVWQKVDTIADGLRAPSVGDLNRPLLDRHVDQVIVVGDEEIKRAMHVLFSKGIVVEPSGAVGLAGFLQEHRKISGTVVILLSGGNVDRETFEAHTSHL
jgi:threonine dehydratase